MDFTEYDSILENCKNENNIQRYLEKIAILYLYIIGFWGIKFIYRLLFQSSNWEIHMFQTLFI